jgi:hypothetical protein
MDVTTDRLCSNEPDIASKIIDGEAILINLRTGAYYSLRGAGAVAWYAIRGHRTRREIVEILAASYPDAARTAEMDLDDLLRALAAEHLVRVSSEDRAIDGDRAGLLELPAPYATPALETFSDMQDLLALDPPSPGVLDGLMRRPLA